MEFTVLQKIVFAVVYAAGLAWNQARRDNRLLDLEDPTDEDLARARRAHERIRMYFQTGRNPRSPDPTPDSGSSEGLREGGSPKAGGAEE